QRDSRRSGGGVLDLRLGGRRRRARTVPDGVLAQREDLHDASPAAPRSRRLLEGRGPGCARSARNRGAVSDRTGVRRGMAPRRILHVGFLMILPLITVVLYNDFAKNLPAKWWPF